MCAVQSQDAFSIGEYREYRPHGMSGPRVPPAERCTELAFSSRDSSDQTPLVPSSHGTSHGPVLTLSCPWPGSNPLIAIDGGFRGGHRGERGVGSGTTALYPAGCGAPCVLTPAFLSQRSRRTAALPPDSFLPHTHGHVSSDC